MRLVEILFRGFADDFKKVAKQVRDGLPIIGLISRITTPEGIGGDEIQVIWHLTAHYIMSTIDAVLRFLLRSEKPDRCKDLVTFSMAACLMHVQCLHLQTYPEFCRQFLEDAPEGFNSAMVQLEKSGTTQVGLPALDAMLVLTQGTAHVNNMSCWCCLSSVC